MKLDIDVAHIRKLDLSSIKERMVNKREQDRITDKHEGSYRLMVWLGHQFNGVTILDIGTRRGSSAICLADNTNNTVITYDIVRTYRDKDVFDAIHSKVSNVKCVLSDVKDIPTNQLLSSPLINLDIGHDGWTEKAFLERLKAIGYNGLVLLDDINFPRKFPRLKIVFDEFPEKKYHIPRDIAHDTGTGLIAYGQHDISIILSAVKSKR